MVDWWAGDGGASLVTSSRVCWPTACAIARCAWKPAGSTRRSRSSCRIGAASCTIGWFVSGKTARIVAGRSPLSRASPTIRHVLIPDAAVRTAMPPSVEQRRYLPALTKSRRAVDRRDLGRDHVGRLADDHPCGTGAAICDSSRPPARYQAITQSRALEAADSQDALPTPCKSDGR